MRLAALSAVKVYAKPGTENLSCSDFDVVGEPVKIDADLLGGPVKATTAWLYTPKASSTSSSNVIVVAIRGSVTTHDWMVNLNDGAERPVQDAFLVSIVMLIHLEHGFDNDRALMTKVASTVLTLGF